MIEHSLKLLLILPNRNNWVKTYNAESEWSIMGIRFKIFYKGLIVFWFWNKYVFAKICRPNQWWNIHRCIALFTWWRMWIVQKPIDSYFHFLFIQKYHPNTNLNNITIIVMYYSIILFNFDHHQQSAQPLNISKIVYC